MKRDRISIGVRVKERELEPGVNLLTTISIFLILLVHIDEYVGLSTRKLTVLPLHGFYVPVFAVGAFVFLSGFKLINSNSNRATGLFLINRFLRIFPLFYLSLVMYTIFMKTALTPLRFAALLGGAHLLFPRLLGNDIPSLWFIGLIGIYYLLFIPLRRHIDKTGRFLLISSVVYSILLLLQTGTETAGYVLEPRVALYFPYFAAGMFAGSRYRKLKPFVPFLVVLVPGVLSVIIAGLALAPWITEYWIVFNNAFLLPINLILILLIIQVDLPSLLSLFVSVLSYSSYCAFLFHRPLWVGFMLLVPKFGSRDALVYYGAVPLVFSFSYLVQKGYDTLLAKIKAR